MFNSKKKPSPQCKKINHTKITKKWLICYKNITESRNLVFVMASLLLTHPFSSPFGSTLRSRTPTTEAKNIRYLHPPISGRSPNFKTPPTKLSSQIAVRLASGDVLQRHGRACPLPLATGARCPPARASAIDPHHDTERWWNP